MSATDRLIGKAHDYEVLAASHSEREALVGGAGPNHSRIDTTQVHPKTLNRSKAMEAVRDLRGAPVSVESSKGPYGIRTRAAAVRGRCPRPLDEWAVALRQCS